MPHLKGVNTIAADRAKQHREVGIPNEWKPAAPKAPSQSPILDELGEEFCVKAAALGLQPSADDSMLGYEVLVPAGYIHTAAVSLWPVFIDARSGSILTGRTADDSYAPVSKYLEMKIDLGSLEANLPNAMERALVDWGLLTQ